MAARKSGNYKPSIWTDDYLQSLTSIYVGEEYSQEANNLRQKTRTILNKTEGRLQQLELIDVLQRLGISYHFEDEIAKIIK